MNEPRQTIGILCIPHIDAGRVLRALRDRHPSARLEGVALPEHVLTEEEAQLFDEVVRVRRPPFSLRHIAGWARFVAWLRSRRYDRLVVLVDARRQVCLAALSGSPVRECWGEDGRVRPLNGSALGILAGRALARWNARLRYAWLWIAVRATPMGKRTRKAKPNREETARGPV